jgi:hypothetical protein
MKYLNAPVHRAHLFRLARWLLIAEVSAISLTSGKPSILATQYIVGGGHCISAWGMGRLPRQNIREHVPIGRAESNFTNKIHPLRLMSTRMPFAFLMRGSMVSYAKNSKPGSPHSTDELFSGSVRVAGGGRLSYTDSGK